MTKPHDNWAIYYDFVYKNTFGNLYQTFTDKTIQVIKEILLKGKILDFGAGTGRLSIPLAINKYEVIAIERSKSMAEILTINAKEKRQEFQINNCSISEFKNGKADMALSLFTVLSYATTENEMKENISSISQNLNTNGYLFFDLPGSVFFNTKILIDINKKEIKRNVTLTNKNGSNIYTYSEDCSGEMKGVKFYYTDKFDIRHWDIKEINQHLKNEGFVKVEKDFSYFESTGSTYHLYQKK
jgi:SAM-dependent methyltransferase